MKASHGYITEALMNQGRTRGQSFTHNGLRVMLNSWMNPRDKVTFIVGENDLCIPDTIRSGTISTQTIVWLLPGHLDIPDSVEEWDMEEAARAIARQHFGGCGEALLLIKELGECPTLPASDIEEIVRMFEVKVRHGQGSVRSKTYIVGEFPTMEEAEDAEDHVKELRTLAHDEWDGWWTDVWVEESDD